MLLLPTAVIISACSQSATSLDPGLGVTASPRVAAGRAVPKGGGVYKVGKPYKVAGRWYVPREYNYYDRSGIASWYGAAFHGRRTANGEIYNMYALTAGHPTLPLPSYAYVTNRDNGRTILVRVNDRGPYVGNRMIDLSWRSARALGFARNGLARVRVRFAGRAPLNGNDAAERRHLASQSWYRGDRRIAQAPSSQITTGAIAAAPSRPDRPVLSYRQRLAGNASDPSQPRRTALGGPGRAYIDVGPFSSRAEAARMGHELEHLGPVAIEQAGEQAGTAKAPPAFQVRLGPLSDAAAEAVTEHMGDFLNVSAAVVTQ